jgi:hypothetical protein
MSLKGIKMENNEMFPELADIMNRIRAFNTAHPEGRFIYAFIGFKKDSENICEECGDECDCLDESKFSMGGFGFLDELRALCNDLRDSIEDNQDEDGFVNF